MATSIVTLALLGYQFWLLHQHCRWEAALQLSPPTLTTSKCFQERVTLCQQCAPVLGLEQEELSLQDDLWQVRWAGWVLLQTDGKTHPR